MREITCFLEEEKSIYYKFYGQFKIHLQATVEMSSNFNFFFQILIYRRNFS